MERSVSSLTYKGSISEAIIEARRQKKVFLVYISGDDENSISLEQTTWMDLSVAESISKHCIFLHLVWGTVDASHFSAIYPQKSIPSISAVGYKGVMLWHHEGYIGAESFVDCIQKAWADLKMQETAATFLTAAIASRKPETSRSDPVDVASCEPGSSSISNNPSASINSSPQGSTDGSCANHALVEDLDCEKRPEVTEKNTVQDDENSSQSALAHDVKIDREPQSSQISETGKDLVFPVTGDATNSTIDTFDHKADSSPAQENFILGDLMAKTALESAGNDQINYTSGSEGSSAIKSGEVEERTQDEKTCGSVSCSNVVKSTDINLNIRFPDGSSLQTKFSKTDTLRSVKNYISQNRVSVLGSYDLAIPYPRKVFEEQDMYKALSELGFSNREALIAIPHRHATRPRNDQLSSNGSPNTVITDSNVNNEGYIGYVKKILSYMNPFSYLGGAANSSTAEPVQNDNPWQYGPNSISRNPLSGREASYHQYSPNLQASPTGDNAGKASKRGLNSSGSNIHTLRDVENDDPSSDRNMFWNGNSTQFGGDDKN